MGDTSEERDKLPSAKSVSKSNPPPTTMTDFPWEIIKQETLRSLSHDLGIKRNMRRDEIIVFLRAVQEQGLGPALVEEISKEYRIGAAGSSLNNHPNAIVSSSSPTGKSPTTPSRRGRPRKRPAPDPEPVETGNNGAGYDTDNNSDNDNDGVVAAAESASPGHTRGKKRVRVSDPGPLRTRSGRRRSVSGLGTRTRGVVGGTRGTRTIATMGTRISPRSRGGNSRRGRKPVVKVVETANDDQGEVTDADAEGEDEVPEPEEEEEEGEEAENTGPSGLAAALLKARKSSTSTRQRSRTRGTTKPRSRSRATNLTRGRRRVAAEPVSTSSWTWVGEGEPSPKSRNSGRLIKPTMKGALLSPTKRPATVLSKPLRNQSEGGKRKRGRPSANGKMSDGVLASTVGEKNRYRESEGPKVVFDGVLLGRRKMGDREMQLDEFVANGLVHGHDAYENGVDLHLGREDLSSLGGSNKENDFSFRNLNDASMSTDGLDGQSIPGEEDAEGDIEPEPVLQDQTQPQADGLPQVHGVAQAHGLSQAHSLPQAHGLPQVLPPLEVQQPEIQPPEIQQPEIQQPDIQPLEIQEPEPLQAEALEPETVFESVLQPVADALHSSLQF